MAFQMSNEGQDDTPIWDGKGKGEWISTVQLSTFQHWSNWKSLDCKIKLSSALYNCLTTIGRYPGSTDTSQLQWRIRGIDTPRYLISSLNIYFRVLRTVLREIRFVSTRVANHEEANLHIPSSGALNIRFDTSNTCSPNNRSVPVVWIRGRPRVRLECPAGNQFSGIPKSSTLHALASMLHRWTQVTKGSGAAVRMVQFD